LLSCSRKSTRCKYLLTGTLDANPQKDVTHSLDDVAGELLDVPGGPLAAMSQFTGIEAEAIAMLHNGCRRS
jgi:hypothetical protein